MLTSLVLLSWMYRQLLPDKATSVRSISQLKIFYMSTDQFLNKRDDLLMLIANEPDILILTEVIPKAQLQPITLSKLTLPGYFIHANFDPDQANLGSSQMRGICIYTSHHLKAVEVHFPTAAFEEHLWISIDLCGSDRLLIGGIYCSPSSNIHVSTKSLCDLL